MSQDIKNSNEKKPIRLIPGFIIVALQSIIWFIVPALYPEALIIGIAQAIAVIPGISRSGATISTSLILGVDREKATRFSFLMVLIPIIGVMLMDFLHMINEPEHTQGISVPILFAGFIAAFISGIAACKWMISIVKKGKLLYFAIYCFIVGLTAIGFSIFNAG